MENNAIIEIKQKVIIVSSEQSDPFSPTMGMKRAFDVLGIDATIKDSAEQISSTPDELFVLIMEQDTSKIASLKNVSCKKIYWNFNHIEEPELIILKDFVDSNSIDIVLNAAPVAIDFMKSDKVKSVWFPHAVDPILSPMMTGKSVKFGFCGDVGENQDFLMQVDAQFPMELMTPPEDPNDHYAKVSRCFVRLMINDSKVVSH